MAAETNTTEAISQENNGSGLAGIPSYNDLFGRNNFAAYNNDRSILSPAAYFVDLMRLQNSTITQKNTDYQLKTRRPELWDIILSVENTEKEVSKLEIVNQVLENRLTKPGSGFTPFTEAAIAQYPFNLPFNAPLNQIRSVLNVNNTSLLAIWKKLGVSNDNIAIACESLGLSPEQWKLYQTQSDVTTTTLAENYGLDTLDDDLSQLTPVKNFLKQTGLSTAQLTQLLNQDLSPTEITAGDQSNFFINVKTNGVTEPIVIDQSSNSLTNLSTDRLDRINRFIRLANATGWNFTELDWCLRSIAYVLNGETSSPAAEINTKTLPYLAWIKQTQQALQCTVEEVTAILGALKNVGKINGVTFFDQLFNNPNIPSIPAWSDQLIWTVPKNSTTETSQQNQQIQAALMAILKLNQDELNLVGNAVLINNNISDQQLPLGIQNLAVLYRLSQLPKLTGFKIVDLTNPNLLPTLKKPFQATASISGKIAYNGLELLAEYAVKIQSSPFSLSLFQYLVTGKGLDTALQNHLLGKDAIQNFLLGLKTAFDSLLLTDSKFITECQDLIGSSFSEEEALATYTKLTSNTLASNLNYEGYSISNGIVVPLASKKNNSSSSTASNSNIQNDDTTASDTKSVSSFIEIVIRYQSLQQHVFTQHLAGLFGISNQYLPIIFENFPFSINNFITIAQSITDSNQPINLDAYKNIEKTIYQPLRLLQRYSLLIQYVGVSPAELQSFQNHAEYYGLLNSSDPQAKDGQLYSLHDLLKLIDLKKMIIEFKDSQNYLINYFDFANPNNYNDKNPAPSVTEIATKLAEITQWDASQIAFLINEHQLDPVVTVTKTQSSNRDPQAVTHVQTTTTTTVLPQPIYATVNGLVQLKNYFELIELIGIDVKTLGLIKDITKTNDTSSYQSYELLANLLWAGLQSNSTTENQIKLTNHANEAKRDALVTMVIHQLNTNTGLKLENARDLYEYLLIDVSVEGIVLTSYIKEAISTVQLYIYRCLNNLEPGAAIINTNDINLNEWWDWMDHYRTWQANREVFLYPENYIEPQLRKRKTPQFAQLEHGLQQADTSNPDNVESVFNKYMDSFSKIANQEIIGCNSYDIESIENGTNQISRNLCFIGKTHSNPHSYYYLNAKFLFNQDQEIKSQGKSEKYEPVEWGAWEPITCHLQSEGKVSPVFAFGKWYIFWIEKQQTGSKKTVTGSNEKVFSAKINYSHLDFNENWTETKLLGTCSYLGESAELSITSVSSINQIMAFYAVPNSKKSGKVFYLSPNQNNIQLSGLFPVSDSSFGFLPTPAPIFTATNGVFQKYNTFGEIPESGNSASISTMFRIDNFPTKGDEYPLINNVVVNNSFPDPINISINSDGKLIDGENSSQEVQKDTWNQLVLTQSFGEEITFQVDVSEFAQNYFTLYYGKFRPDDSNNAIYLFGEYKEDIYYSQFALNSAGIANNESKTNKIDGAAILSKSIPNIIQLDEHYYFAYINTSMQPRIGYLKVSDSSCQFIHITNNSNPDKDETGSNYLVLGTNTPSFAKTGSQIDAAWTNQSHQIMYASNINGDSFTPVPLKIGSTNANSNSRIAMTSGYFDEGIQKKIIAWNSNEKASKLKIGVIGTENQISQIFTFNMLNSPLNATFPFFTIDGDKISIVWEVESLPNNSVSIYKADVTVPNDPDLPITISEPSILPAVNGRMYTMRIFDGNQCTAASTPANPQNKITIDGSLVSKVSRAWYLNGEKVGSSSTVQNNNASLSLGRKATDTSIVDIQETLLFSEILTTNDIVNLWKDSSQLPNNQLSYGVLPSTAFTSLSATSTQLSVANQSNWYIIKQNGAQYLYYPYIQNGNTKVNCIRLNSTAANTLGQKLQLLGVGGLLDIVSQQSKEIAFSNLSPNDIYFETGNQPSNQIDFYKGPMSKYYWEIFFHAPFLVGNTLQTQLQFESAKDWYQYIFNPTINPKNADLNESDTHLTDSYWRFIGLRAYDHTVLETEHENSSANNYQNNLGNAAQLFEYHNDPFDAHAIANLRPQAYQKAVVMHYIDNLITWGDNLFKAYTREDIEEAEMLYVMAYDLLGKKAIDIPNFPLPEPEDLSSILKVNDRSLSDIHEFLVNIDPNASKTMAVKATPSNYILNDYFGIPGNNHFNNYWTTVKERLYDIRNSLNIKGKFSELPLFQPAIDPVKLVAQAASGEYIQTPLPLTSASIPYYRFDVIIQKAKEVTQTVIGFGNSLLTVLEKKDNTQLVILDNINQQHLLNLTTASKQDALNQISETVATLQIGLESAKSRSKYYTDLINNGYIQDETNQIALESSSIVFQSIAKDAQTGVSVASALPTIFGLSDGGMNFSEAAKAIGQISKDVGGILSTSANIAGIQASFARRKQEWQFQQELSEDEVTQAIHQLQAAQYQEQIAKQEIVQLNKSIAHAQKVEAFMKNKFTNEQLHNWTISKLSSLYFQVYQLANDLALQAQNAWQFEKGIDLPQSYIQHGNWDNLHHGLLAGEALQLDLQRMEAAYLKQDQRRLEIRKTIALSSTEQFPNVLDTLKSSGTCQFSITEKMLDLDYPGHYCRQIKSISISIPTVLGPYENIHATLSQTSNKTITKPEIDAVNQLLGVKSDTTSKVIKPDLRSSQQIAISSGMDDTGMFQLNFNDPRYLPFEGTGVVSSWELNIPTENNPGLTDTSTNDNPTLNISEVIIEVSYTAIDGGSTFAQSVKNALNTSQSE